MEKENLDGSEGNDVSGSTVFCYCQSTYDPASFYIACDSCDQWFHGVCARVKPEEAERLSVWLCPLCSGRRFPAKRVKVETSNSSFSSKKVCSNPLVTGGKENKVNCRSKSCESYSAKAQGCCSFACSKRYEFEKQERDRKRKERGESKLEIKRREREEHERFRRKVVHSEWRLERISGTLKSLKSRLSELSDLQRYRKRVLATLGSRDLQTCGFVAALISPSPNAVLLDKSNQACTELAGKCSRHEGWLQVLLDRLESEILQLKGQIETYESEKVTLESFIGQVSFNMSPSVVDVM